MNRCAVRTAIAKTKHEEEAFTGANFRTDPYTGGWLPHEANFTKRITMDGKPVVVIAHICKHCGAFFDPEDKDGN